jgi:hypothetical protein
MKCTLMFSLMAVAVSAQTPEPAPTIERYANGNFSYQVICTGRGSGIGSGLNGVVSLGGRVVKGRPFSATEDNKSLQVLGNGTRIENNTKRKLFRDVDGRTRMEEADGTIIIADPVAGFEARLDPKTKTATKTNGGGRGIAYVVGQPANVASVRIGNKGSELREALGLQALNGVTAHGERVTVTIPKGEIGNDRDLKVINERWTSDDLQLLIKSTNTDPRYGDTSYELSGISLAGPDKALFEIPADYTITEGAARGGAVRLALPAIPAIPVSPAKPAPRGGKQ